MADSPPSLRARCRRGGSGAAPRPSSLGRPTTRFFPARFASYSAASAAAISASAPSADHGDRRDPDAGGHLDRARRRRLAEPARPRSARGSAPRARPPPRDRSRAGPPRTPRRRSAPARRPPATRRRRIRADPAQHLVALEVAIGVVDLLEVVDVEHDQRQLVAEALGARRPPSRSAPGSGGCWTRPVSSSVIACSPTSSCSAMFSIDADAWPDQVEEHVALRGRERARLAGDGHHADVRRRLADAAAAGLAERVGAAALLGATRSSCVRARPPRPRRRRPESLPSGPRLGLRRPRGRSGRSARTRPRRRRSAVSTTTSSSAWRSRPEANASPIRRTDRSISTCWRRSSSICSASRSLILLNSLGQPRHLVAPDHRHLAG